MDSFFIIASRQDLQDYLDLLHSCFQEETRKMQSASRKEIPFGLQAVYSDTAGNKLVNPAFADLMQSFRR